MGGTGAARAPGADGPARGSARDAWLHAAAIVALCGAFDALFLHHGIGWLFDEGWPLYAAMQLHRGGTLYDDVFFLFPPGHLLPAWLAYAWAPPGVLVARILYGAFDVALCLALYALGRRLVPPAFALWAALALAVAAPSSHLLHLLFGYRYLVWSVLALLAADRCWRGHGRGFMGLAGVCGGLALVFRLTPAFAVSCGIAVASLATTPPPRALRDLAAYAAGLAAVALPVLAWLAAGAGLPAVFSQVVVRILPLQSAQSLPLPPLHWLPVGARREDVEAWFVGVQFALYPALYAGYAAALLRAGWRGGRQRVQPLLLALVVWGAVYGLRVLGRSDEHHLASALPPALLLLAHALSRPFERGALAGRGRAALAVAALLALWIGLQGSDRYLDPRVRGIHPLAALDGAVSIRNARDARRIDASVARIRRLSRPDERVLDLSHAPLLLVLADRLGPGYADVVTPGVFADPEDERRFLERLERDPPELVLWPRRPFDGRRDRALDVHAPRLARWVRARYRPVPAGEFHEILLVRADR